MGIIDDFMDIIDGSCTSYMVHVHHWWFHVHHIWFMYIIGGFMYIIDGFVDINTCR
ncbi:hypothetical protein METBIDRAFT_30174 [Metschnikowia bicuspidata var. bicuspidata NRRL YB-4993]|uniref:Uncharacterized protein n=1 Tax=Metschnikowia bicuspidata var. bicuspidata NRRL YB-4993 TaxID=869754 RepID=A0A1A0HIV3_9ASCO|nr:hypothetical protein METBIDRAFT_30174 [Metschnikowia bicuspidata var. bicuspidata NRRL YB-4993]OBA23768.1 hypothetical protein METBIDRAFT_30174 [Metschnikowia bicuspidata var. bicuspidata NRRL YB-4993]